MFNDPGVLKIIVFVLAGMVAVLSVAVVFLALQKNTYYVDEDNKIVKPKTKPKTANRFLQKLQFHEEEETDDDVKIAQPVRKAPLKEEISVQPAAAAPIPVPEIKADPIMEPAVDKEETTVMDLEEVEIPPADKFIEPKKASEPEKPVSVEVKPQEQAKKEELTILKTSAARGVVINIRVGNMQDDRTITRFPCLIGREAGACNMVIQEPAISRRHAKFVVENGQLYIADVSEHNGTFVNGKKLPSLGSVVLHNGDRISIGRALITIKEILY